MIRNYLKIALRYLYKNKVHSIINIAGLSVGMSVAMLIGLWIRDEVRYDRFPDHFDRIAQVRQTQTLNGAVKTRKTIPVPLAAELRISYGNDFKYIVLSSYNGNHILTVGEKNLSQPGNFMGSDAPELFSLKMLKGSRNGLTDPSSIFLSVTVSKALFGEVDPINRVLRLDNDKNLTVTGVYEDFPYSSSFRYTSFIAPWDFYAKNTLSETSITNWSDNSFFLYVQVADKADMASVSQRIRDVKVRNVSKEDAKYNSLISLQPMSRWHLYSEFKNGVDTGGKIEYVWMFGIIGVFVLLLACINFMNLSTARSEKRAKEVGIRKAIGSLRRQLIVQFFSESILVACFAFVLSLALVSVLLPFFNTVADKKMSFLWGNWMFWAAGIGFVFFTGLMAGSYPALYLSSFRPVKVLKGVFRAGSLAAIPRKVLVVLQFTVSVILIIGTIVVFRQIQYARTRPVGYSRNGLVSVAMATGDLFHHIEAVRHDLLKSGMVSGVAVSNSPTTGVNFNSGGLEWTGKDPGLADDFAAIRVTTQYGKTVGWQFTQGRDFSTHFVTDSSAMILNETAVQYMGFANPIGEIIRWNGNSFHVIGVIRNMVMESPYEPVKQTIFCIGNHFSDDYLNVRINPDVSALQALAEIESVCKQYSPSSPFVYKFADEEYARKFSDELRIGKLAGFFAILAVFISCLGLFGMATFMAEQRIKEIGVRKVLGASVFNLWRLLSKEFVMLVVISLLIAVPIAYYFMGKWLLHYPYHSDMAWWEFAAASGGALLITLLTVSYQSIKAALMNPVKSLRSE
jgi:putative ABC transport system permease protein